MPTEIAKASLSESSCFCICAFSTCLSCTYCVSSLFQVLQEVVYEWIMVSLLQQSTYNHAIIYLFSQHSLPVFSVLVPILGKQRWAESSPLGSHCCQVVECRFPAWLSDSTALSWLMHPQVKAGDNLYISNFNEGDTSVIVLCQCHREKR